MIYDNRKILHHFIRKHLIILLCYLIYAICLIEHFEFVRLENLHLSWFLFAGSLIFTSFPVIAIVVLICINLLWGAVSRLSTIFSRKKLLYYYKLMKCYCAFIKKSGDSSERRNLRNANKWCMGGGRGGEIFVVFIAICDYT